MRLAGKPRARCRRRSRDPSECPRGCGNQSRSDQLGQQSRFRVDLFHRLNVLSIRVPPLSERADDLAPLTQHFLGKYRSLCCGGLPEVGADFLDALQQIALPGNVRQLENLIRQTLVRRRTDTPWGLMISRRKPGGNYRKVQMLCRRRSEKVKRRASWIRTSSRGTFASCWTQTVGISPGPWRIARGRQSKRRCSALTATRASLLGRLGLRRAAFTTRCGNIGPGVKSLQ